MDMFGSFKPVQARVDGISRALFKLFEGNTLTGVPKEVSDRLAEVVKESIALEFELLSTIVFAGLELSSEVAQQRLELSWLMYWRGVAVGFNVADRADLLAQCPEADAAAGLLEAEQILREAGQSDELST